MFSDLLWAQTQPFHMNLHLSFTAIGLTFFSCLISTPVLHCGGLSLCLDEVTSKKFDHFPQTIPLHCGSLILLEMSTKLYDSALHGSQLYCKMWLLSINLWKYGWDEKSSAIFPQSIPLRCVLMILLEMSTKLYNTAPHGPQWYCKMFPLSVNFPKLWMTWMESIYVTLKTQCSNPCVTLILMFSSNCGTLNTFVLVFWLGIVLLSDHYKPGSVQSFPNYLLGCCLETSWTRLVSK